MPDLAMCHSKVCPDRQACYRFRAQPSSRQSFASFAPEPGRSRCDSFSEIRPGDRLATDEVSA